MPTKHIWSALFATVVAIGSFVYTLAVGNEPLLGLDLQGGVSVVYEPTSPTTEEALDQTLEIIRSRVDALGVAEPEISRQGSTIVVDLPGVTEQQRALDLIGQTAELRFRPVIADLGQGSLLELDPDALEDFLEENEGAPIDGEDEESLGAFRNRRQTDDAEAEPTDDAEPTDEAEPTEDSESNDDGTDAGSGIPLTATELAAQQACFGDLTAPEDDIAEAYVLLPTREGGRLCLGPTMLRGDALEDADVSLDRAQWAVNPVFREGPDGIERFNAVAALCFNATEVCPTQRLAIVLDHVSISAPSINAPSFDRDRIIISGSFTEDEARDLTTSLKFGALPVELEPQATRTVSATIGDDVLRSGVIAGLIGLGLVAIYLLAYYRLAGMVALTGLLFSGFMLWSIISWFGETQGLAITLSGIVGLIVAIGVSADSNIVYFENVKDSVRSGRKVPTAVERAYRTSISTILKADIVSLIAAVLLYFLTVGAVRGFAFYLGIATLLDLFVAYFFMRPALLFLSGLQAARSNPRLLGLVPAVES